LVFEILKLELITKEVASEVEVIIDISVENMLINNHGACLI